MLPSILIVDDDIVMSALLGEIFEGVYKITYAYSGIECLSKLFSSSIPDLVILDISLGDMTGFSVLEKMKSSYVTEDIPVIFITGRDSYEDECKGFALGAVDYITKPFFQEIVTARVKMHFENKKARDFLIDQTKFLEAEVARRMHDNEVIQSATLIALANLAETRDNDTGNHIQRTRSYVQTLATYLLATGYCLDELEGDKLMNIVRSAPLHDIGKVGIPDNILLKPGKLTPEEWLVMKTHTTIGGTAICQAIRKAESAVGSCLKTEYNCLRFLEAGKQIAQYHHEMWDGTGYPEGLHTTEIPLSARIMALADVYDALLSVRPYKKAFSHEEAKNIIYEGRGSHFDPAVVDAFFACESEFVSIAKALADEPPANHPL